MTKDKQIEEMFNIIVDGVIDGEDNNGVPTGNTCVNIAETLYNAGYRKASEVASNIFGNLRILGHIDFDGNFCIRKDAFEELEKQYTEEGK